MAKKRLGKGDSILIKAPNLFYAYDGNIKRTICNYPAPYAGRFIRVDEEEIGIIIDVIVVPITDMYNGRHLIVQLKSGTIDIWTSQDQFSYRHVK